MTTISNELIGERHVGIEFVDKTCWKCSRPVFTISGIVTTDPNCSGWSKERWRSDDWRILDFYALYQSDDAVAQQLSDAINGLNAEHAKWLAANRKQFVKIEKREIKAAREILWTSVCRGCKQIDGPAILIEKERPRLIAAWAENLRARKLIYRGITLDFAVPQKTYNDIKFGTTIYKYLER